MTPPTIYFVRVYTPDPEAQDADRQEDLDFHGLGPALRSLHRLQKAGQRAQLFKRVGVTEERVQGIVIGYGFDTVEVEQ
jgi:hypothetical protein